MWRRFLSVFRRGRLDDELSSEVEFHLAMLVEEKIQRGMPPEEAMAAARREFGGVEQMKERYRDARGLPMLESVLADCAHAVRMMRLNPLLSVAITLTLALGIGATTAVFTVANTVLLRPLQIPDPDRAVVLLSTNPREGTAFSVAEGVFTDWRERAKSLEAMAGCWDTSMILHGIGQPREITAVKATAAFFNIAGIQAKEGRLFDASAEQAGQDNVAVLDEGFWRREFGGRLEAIGGPIVLDDRPYTVIGVVPSGFALGKIRRTDVWVPLAARTDVRTGGAVNVIGRMRPGVTRAAAQAEMNVIQERIKREHREDSAFGVEVRTLRDWVVNDARPALMALMGAVALLLLLCCVNIANLLLARATARQREFAIRASLGGGHARLTRQVLTENLVLAALGGMAGLVVAALLLQAVPFIRGFHLPRLDEIHPDGRMLLITMAVTIASSLIFGLVPAWRSATGWTRSMLGTAAPASAITPAGIRLRRVLVVAQLGLSLVLLCGAGLLLNSFVRLTTVNVGFSRANVVSAGVRLPYKQYDASRSLLFNRLLMEEVRALPGVLDVSATDYLPLQAVRFPYRLSVDGRAGASVEAMARNVEPRYFQVLGVPMVAGREFERADDTRSPVPVILNVETAGRLFGGERDALGLKIGTNYRSRAVLEVIGVASNVRQLGLREDPGPQIYLPMKFGSGKYVIARLAGNAGDLSAAIRAAVFRLDPAIPAPEVANVGTWFEFEVAKPRLYMLLAGVFAFAGLLIATAGVYGVVAFNVARRTHEFGVRLALGAERRDIVRLVLAREAPTIVAGLLLGLGGALGVTRLLSALLYGVRPGDTPTFLAAGALLSGVALLACYLPGRRAAGLDPAVALRHE